MKKNLGSTDKLIRILLGLVIIFLGVKYQTWWGALGLILPITALINWCPIYAFFGLNSQGKK